MLKNYNLSIIASFLGLWMTSFFKNEYQVFIGFLLIFSFGILHGANDLAVLKKIYLSKKSKSYYKLIGSYLLVVLISAILFIIIPWLALLLFIIISGFHFGEQHWNELSINTFNWFKVVFHFNYGLFILLLLFAFHANEVEKIIYSITSVSIANINMNYLMLFFGITLGILFLYCFLKSDEFKNKIGEELLYLLVFTILFKVASLIWGFALYFIFWHSIPSLQDQIKFLYGKYSFKNFVLYFKAAFVYWLVSLAGIFGLYMLLNKNTIFNALFFSILAAITFQHVLVIIKMFNQKA